MNGFRIRQREKSDYLTQPCESQFLEFDDDGRASFIEDCFCNCLVSWRWVDDGFVFDVLEKGDKPRIGVECE